MLWKKQLESAIQGKIQQVDIYKNGKLQLAFTTNNKLLILDRNGKEVAPFTIKHEGGNLNPLAVFDYDGKKDYRFLVTQGPKVFMYNNKGKIVSGFKYKKAESDILGAPQHFRINKKDYLCFKLANGQLKLLNRVGKYGVEHGVKLPTMKTVLAGGAPVTLSTMAIFQSLLSDDSSILTTYGSTEALPISSIDYKTLESECRHKTESGAGTCIGKPLESVDVSIISITDDPIENWDDSLLLPQGDVGEIVLKGGIVSQHYYQNQEANALNKIKDENENRHRMGDLGQIDEDGQLWFCGRKKHRVSSPENLLFSVQCEGIFNQHPDVFRSALVGVGPEGNQKPIICIELESSSLTTQGGHKTPESIQQELLKLAEKHSITENIKTVLFHDAFPVDIRHNAKIGREELAKWAEQKELNNMTNTSDFSTKDKLLMLIPIFGWLFIAYGLVFPIENVYIKWMWYIDIFLSVVVHLLQLFVGIPVGKKSGYSTRNSVYLTIIFGATWWKPLRQKLSAQ